MSLPRQSATNDRADILNAVRDQPGLTIPEIASVVGVRQHWLSMLLLEYHTGGLVRRQYAQGSTGSRRPWRYFLTDKGYRVTGAEPPPYISGLNDAETVIVQCLIGRPIATFDELVSDCPLSRLALIENLATLRRRDIVRQTGQALHLRPEDDSPIRSSA